MGSLAALFVAALVLAGVDLVLLSSAPLPGVNLGTPAGASPACDGSVTLPSPPGRSVPGGYSGFLGSLISPVPVCSCALVAAWVTEKVFGGPLTLISVSPVATVGVRSALVGSVLATKFCMRPVSGSVSKGFCLAGLSTESSLTVCPAVFGGVGNVPASSATFSRSLIRSILSDASRSSAR